MHVLQQFREHKVKLSADILVRLQPGFERAQRGQTLNDTVQEAGVAVVK